MNKKNPSWAIVWGVGGWTVERYNDLYSKCFWWPFELDAYSFHGSELKMPEGLEENQISGQVVFALTYKANMRMRSLKANGWHNAGPDISRKCFMFCKKENWMGGSINSEFRIAVKWGGDVFVWVHGGQKEERFDQFVNLLNMLH